MITRIRTPRVPRGLVPAVVSALIVEDDPVLRGALSRMLEQEGVEVLAVEGIAAARAALAAYAPDLVISDVRLEDGSGLDLARQVRALHDGRVCVVLMSGVGASVTEALLAGADEFVAKPFAPEHLLCVCAALLRKAGKALRPDA